MDWWLDCQVTNNYTELGFKVGIYLPCLPNSMGTWQVFVNYFKFNGLDKKKVENGSVKETKKFTWLNKKETKKFVDILVFLTKAGF